MFFLNQLAPDERISVPTVLGYGREGTIEYTVMTRMPGTAVVNTTRAGEARRQTLYKLGQTLRRIHSVAQEPFVASRQFPGDATLGDLKHRFEENFEGLAKRMRDKEVPWTLALTPEQVARKAPAVLPRRCACGPAFQSRANAHIRGCQNGAFHGTHRFWRRVYQSSRVGPVAMEPAGGQAGCPGRIHRRWSGGRTLPSHTQGRHGPVGYDGNCLSNEVTHGIQGRPANFNGTTVVRRRSQR